MKLTINVRPLSLLALAALATLALGACQKDATSTTRTTGASVPAGEDTNVLQSNEQSSDLLDLSVTQRIRRAMLADDSLSADAKKVTVVTEDGVVTLRGPVRSDAERAKVDSMARGLAGHNRLEDLIEVQPTSAPPAKPPAK